MESAAVQSLDQGEAATSEKETSPEVLTTVCSLSPRPQTDKLKKAMSDLWLLIYLFSRCCSGPSVRVTSLCADTAATAARTKAVGSAAGSNNRNHTQVSPLIGRDGMGH